MPSTTAQLQDNTDTSLSRMRAHKGNVPSLPQTKYCSLCPAKFTRTTHLNRHLRSHTNERLHRCNICKSSEFTRSDLLTRHKRTCGQSVNRSRRKSCEACAESKIKCNLQYPCAKCTSRGRECVFQNDPEESRSKSLSSKGGARKSSNSLPAHGSAPHTPPPSPKIPSLLLEDSSRTTSTSPFSHFLSLPALSESGASSEESSSHSSPRSEDFQSFDEQQPFNFPFDIGTYEEPLTSTLTPFDRSLFQSPSPGFLSSTLIDEIKADSTLNSDNEVSLDVDEDMDLFASLIRPPNSPPSLAAGSCTNLLMSQPTVTLNCLDALDMQCLSGTSTSALDTYLHLFFTRFVAQVPLIHAPTWKMAETPPTLMRIFHACGALFVKTPESATFVETTLRSVTADISEQFSSVNDTPDSSVSRNHTHLIIGLVLLQTICLFQREGGGLAPQNAQHHAMLVSMIRQTDLIERVKSWTAPDWSDPISLETAWIEWAQFATIKRALLLAYFHDCCHCMYSASPPAFSPAELDVHLPCDDALWRAPSAAEWFAVAHTPSPYGVGIARIYGVSMQQALTVLATPPTVNLDTINRNETAARLHLTPFALFLLIHTVLRNISVAQRAPPPGGWSCFALVAAQVPSGAEFTFRTQVILDNWLQLWLSSPEAALPAQENSSSGQEPPFVCNSLPFYWLAQVSLWENSSGPAFLDLDSKADCPGPVGWVGHAKSTPNHADSLDATTTKSPTGHLEEMAIDRDLLL